jgi:uncharacterized membrane-anchored protein YitT (DUF2179 family)
MASNNGSAPEGAKHSFINDVTSILTGTFVAAFGMFLLDSAHLVTGGTTGLSLLINYVVPVPFSYIYLALAVPFLTIGLMTKGLNFTLRSAVSVLLVAGFEPYIAAEFGSISVDQVFASIAGNLLLALGLLVIFRHQSSLGGITVLAVIAQERWGWRAGYVQMAFDSVIILASLAITSPLVVLYSAVGAVILNFSLAMNHRPGRYQGY